MPAIPFLAPKAGEARRKEASRKGTNGRKERRKEGSQEGRKELKEGAKEASKSGGKEERCFIGKHCIHQVPSSSQPPSFWYSGTVLATYLSVPRMGNVKRAQNGHHYSH